MWGTVEVRKFKFNTPMQNAKMPFDQ